MSFQDRPYQVDAIERSLEALDRHKNTLLCAPTGAGKTYMGSRVVETSRGRLGTALVLQHTSKLMKQNAETFRALYPDIDHSVVKSGGKRDWSGWVVFGSLNTVYRNLGEMEAFDIIMIDEGHRIAGAMYQAILERARQLNPNVKIFAVTATPERADKKALLAAGITNMAYDVDIWELIDAGVLVKPRIFAQEVGIEEVVSQPGYHAPRNFFAEDPAVSALMNKDITKEAVLKAYREHGEGGQFVWFAPSVATAEAYTKFFNENGESATLVHGGLSKAAQDTNLEAYEAGEFQHIFNVFLLVEGWDHPPTKGMGILRNFSHFSPTKQAVGRVLRAVDPVKHPGVVKDYGLILDFSASMERWSDHLFKRPRLEAGGRKGDAPTKECKECGFEVHLSARVCPNCQAPFPVKIQTKDRVIEAVMVEKKITRKSKWRWLDLGPSTKSVIQLRDGAGANTALVRHDDSGAAAFWKTPGKPAERVHDGDVEECIAVLDDMLNRSGDAATAAKKSAAWMRKPPTHKQIKFARDVGVDLNAHGQLDRYRIGVLTNARRLLKEIKKERLLNVS